MKNVTESSTAELNEAFKMKEITEIISKVFGKTDVTNNFKNKFAYHVTEYLKKADITNIIIVDQYPKVLAHYYGDPAEIIALLMSALIKIVEEQQSNLDEKDFEEGKRQIIDALKHEFNI